MTQVPQHIKDRIDKVVLSCVDKAKAHFNRAYRVPTVRYSVKGRLGGYASGTDLINMNPILLMENVEEYCNQVVPHEVAHCIDTANGDNSRPDWHMRNGRRMKRSIHGPTWKHIMSAVFGLQPDRCHQMDTTNAQVRTKAKYEYKCACCNRSYFVSSVLHNRIRTGQSRWCRVGGRTRGQLTYVGFVGKAQPVVRIPEQIAANAPAVVTKEVPALSLLPPGTVRGVELARRIFEYGGNLTRQQFIANAVAAGMKATTASTYYAQMKRG